MTATAAAVLALLSAAPAQAQEDASCQKVRFAVAIPYLHKDLSDFLDKNRSNSHLKRSELTKSRLGKRSVDLLQIGVPDAGRRARGR